MEFVKNYIERISVLALAAAICDFAIPNGSMKKSAQYTLSLILFICALEPLIKILGGGV